MLHPNNLIIKQKMSLLKSANALGNVEKACIIMEVSHEAFYQYHKLTQAKH